VDLDGEQVIVDTFNKVPKRMRRLLRQLSKRAPKVQQRLTKVQVEKLAFLLGSSPEMAKLFFFLSESTVHPRPLFACFSPSQHIGIRCVAS
jgi:hypothetical protein